MSDLVRIETKVDNLIDDVEEVKGSVTALRDFMMQNLDVKEEQKELEKRIRRLEIAVAGVTTTGGVLAALAQIFS